MSAGGWSARLSELGIELPPVVKPVAAYVPAVQTGSLVYTAGQLPMVAGELPAAGAVGGAVTPEAAKALARICALNALAAVDSLGVRVLATAGFHGQPGVVNGASELFGEVFGEAGAHARSAVGVAELPLNAPVEVELIVEVA